MRQVGRSCYHFIYQSFSFLTCPMPVVLNLFWVTGHFEGVLKTPNICTPPVRTGTHKLLAYTPGISSDQLAVRGLSGQCGGQNPVAHLLCGIKPKYTGPWVPSPASVLCLLPGKEWILLEYFSKVSPRCLQEPGKNMHLFVTSELSPLLFPKSKSKEEKKATSSNIFLF